MISSNIGLSASKAEVEAALNVATAESASTIGIRTTSIQLLRDAMYRACEAYASGALKKREYARLTKRYQKSMVTLLAIEQLTTTVYPPTVSLTSTSNNEYNKQILEATKAEIAIKDKLEKLQSSQSEAATEVIKSEKEVGVAKEEVDKYKQGSPSINGQDDPLCKDSGNKTQCDNLKGALTAETKAKTLYEEAKTKKGSLDVNIKRAEGDLIRWQTVLQQMKEPSRDVAVSSKVSPNTRTITESNMTEVAGTIERMLEDVYEADLIEVCFDPDLIKTILKAEESPATTRSESINEVSKRVSESIDEKGGSNNLVVALATSNVETAKNNYKESLVKYKLAVVNLTSSNNKTTSRNAQLALAEAGSNKDVAWSTLKAASAAKDAAVLATTEVTNKIKAKSSGAHAAAIERFNQQNKWCETMINYKFTYREPPSKSTDPMEGLQEKEQ